MSMNVQQKQMEQSKPLAVNNFNNCLAMSSHEDAAILGAASHEDAAVLGFASGSASMGSSASSGCSFSAVA